MKNASILFQGPSIATQRSNHARFNDLAWYQEIASLSTALSYNGICCYLDELRSLTCNPQAVRSIHVLPGQIRYKDRSYEQIQDSKLDMKAAPKVGFKENARISPASIESGETLIGAGRQSTLKLQAIAFESSIQTILYCSYRVLMPIGSLDLYLSQLTMRILQHSGQIPCSFSSKCRKHLAIPCSTVRDGWMVDPEKTKQSWQQSTD